MRNLKKCMQIIHIFIKFHFQQNIYTFPVKKKLSNSSHKLTEN